MKEETLPKNLLRINFMKYSSWLFTDIDKAAEFLNEVLKINFNTMYTIDFLTQHEINQFHHDYEFCQLERINCTIKFVDNIDYKNIFNED